MATTGERIREAREAAGMTKADLQRKLGVQHHQVIAWEKGRMPNPERLSEIARELDVSVDWLLCRDERVDDADVDGAPTAPEDVVERVIADVGLTDDQAEKLRRQRWSVGIPSEATLCSIALDMKSAARREASEGDAAPAKASHNGFMRRGKKA